MSTSRARLGDAVTPGLAGLSIAAGIAREAVDAVPVVKQVLGVIVRILALAEKIDKDRDALHELVKKSVQLAERVNAVLGDQTGDELFQPSIEKIRGVFEEIAEYMQKHVSRSRLSRTFGYAFTVKLHVDRLSRKLEDAVQELFMVAHITTTLTVRDGARFDGGFRFIHHCEVDKLDRIHGRDHRDADGNAIVHYHRARVDGTLLVVRYFVGNVFDGSCREAYESVLSCDRILEELSTVQRSHPNVARIYGRSKGSIHDRFTVFKSGYHATERILSELPDPQTTAFQWDAVEHLRRQGICWRAPSPPYAVDEHLEPTIGLGNDLCRSDPEIDPLDLDDIAHQVVWAVYSHEVAATDVRAAVADCHNEQLTSVLGKFETTRRRRFVVRKCSLSSGFALNDTTVERLRVLAENLSDYGWQVYAGMWADILLVMVENRSHRIQHGIRVIYFAREDESDWFVVSCVAEDSESIVCDQFHLEIPDPQRDEVRAVWSISAPSGEEPARWRIIATGAPGTYHALD